MGAEDVRGIVAGPACDRSRLLNGDAYPSEP